MLRRSIPLLPVLLSYFAGLFIFAFSYILYRLLHYGVWSNVAAGYRGRFSVRGGDEEYVVPFSLFSLEGEEKLASGLNEEHASHADSVMKKFARASVCWQYADEILLPVGGSDDVLGYLRSKFKAGKDRTAGTRAGLLFVYFHWINESSPEPGDAFRLYSDFVGRLADVVTSYQGTIFHVTGSMAAVSFSGDWEDRETAVRTIKAAREAAALFSGKQVPAGGGFVVADYLPLVEGVLSASQMLKYCVESPEVSRYLGVTPVIPENPLTVSARLVAAVRGGAGEGGA